MRFPRIEDTRHRLVDEGDVQRREQRRLVVDESGVLEVVP
jgi:hypothetical protein